MNSVDRLEEAHKQVGIALQDDSFELSEIRRCQLEDVHGILQQFVDADRWDVGPTPTDGESYGRNGDIRPVPPGVSEPGEGQR